jgi:hypothetical protein
MPRLVLPGGTDVAEVAIFSLDALPQRLDRDTVARLERERSLIRFNTGADGGYLLHAYVDEQIPDDLLKYCDIADRKIATLIVSGGHVGFGGSESTYAEFSPNVAIRTDARIPPGTYEVTAYHTSYPDDEIDRAVRERIGASGQRLLHLPGYIIPVGVLLALASWFVSHWYVVAVVVATAGVVLLFTKHPAIVQLQAEAHAAELDHPSIVLSMTSNPTSNNPLKPSA